MDHNDSYLKTLLHNIKFAYTPLLNWGPHKKFSSFENGGLQFRGGAPIRE